MKIKEILSETILYQVRQIFERDIVLIETIIQAVFRNTARIFKWNIVENNELSRERVRNVAKSGTKIRSINNAWKQF